jgi:hypothetical protein
MSSSHDLPPNTSTPSDLPFGHTPSDLKEGTRFGDGAGFGGQDMSYEDDTDEDEDPDEPDTGHPLEPLSMEAIIECPNCGEDICEVCLFNEACEACGKSTKEMPIPQANIDRVLQFKAGLRMTHDDEGWGEDDEDDEDYENEFPEPIVRAKWIMDGATTLSEAATRIEGFAAWLRELEAQGWQLSGPVEDDYGYLAWTGDPTKRPAWYEGEEDLSKNALSPEDGPSSDVGAPS